MDYVMCLFEKFLKDFLKSSFIGSLYEFNGLDLLNMCTTLFNDLTRDSIANNFVIDIYCRCLQILYPTVFFYKI